MAPLNPPARLIRFDNFELDAANRGGRVRLQPKQFALLVMLAERAGQTISREEIRERIWDRLACFIRGPGSRTPVLCVSKEPSQLDTFASGTIEDIPRGAINETHLSQLSRSDQNTKGHPRAPAASSLNLLKFSVAQC
jgi:Transcriptional regulatory protein, C terminal